MRKLIALAVALALPFGVARADDSSQQYHLDILSGAFSLRTRTEGPATLNPSCSGGGSTTCTWQVPLAQSHAQSTAAIGLRVSDSTGRFALLDSLPDPLGTASAIALVGKTWPLAARHGYALDGGIGAGFWDRSVVDATGAALTRKFALALMPTATVRSPSGLGLSFLLEPPGAVFGARSWGLLTQLSFRFF